MRAGVRVRGLLSASATGGYIRPRSSRPQPHIHPTTMHRPIIVLGAALILSAIHAGCASAQPSDPSALRDLQAASRAIAADEAARLRGDSAAWTRVGPGFVFVHSTGAVDDLATFQRFRAAGSGGTVRSAAGAAARRQPTGTPVERLDGDVFVRVQLLSDSAPPGGRAGQSRVTDVYVQRADGWHWLVHQTAEVSARLIRRTVPAADLAAYAGAYVSP